MKKLKSFMAIMCSFLLVVNCNNATFCSAKRQVVKSEKKEIKRDLRLNQKDLTRKDRDKVKNAINMAQNNIESVAKLINEYNDDAFYVSVDSVLDYYYEKKDKNSIAIFERTIDKRAEELLEQYSEANCERESENELEYLPSTVIASFDENIPVETIYDVVEDQNAECIILDEKYPISDSLPKDKKEKIEKVLDMMDTRIAIIETSNRQTVELAMEEYMEYNVFEHVEKSYKSEVEAYTNDPKITEQTDEFDFINASEAWNLFDGNDSEMWVAVIDTGLRYTHKDIDSVVSDYSYDILQDCLLKNSTKPYLSDHGTHVAGIIAAESNNSIGITGLATKGDNGRCKIMAIQASFLGDDNRPYFSDETIIKSLYYAIVNGADVINMSLGGERNDGGNPEVQKMIDMAYYLNIPVVAAVGNGDPITGKYIVTDEFYPAAYNHVIGVGNCMTNGQMCIRSNHGAMVDVCAPGVSILSLGSGSDNQYCEKDGTSMATPFVSATIALMKSISFNKLSYDNIEYNLQKTAYGKGVRLNDSCGYGLINCGEAVKMSKNDIVNPTYQYALEKLLFDATFYADCYPDLKAAYGYNRRKLYNHWRYSGRREGRRISIAFDLGYYLQYNIDLINAFGRNNYATAFNHFVQTGYSEYRPMSHVFDVRYYRDYYYDLRSMSSYQLIEHFVYNGIDEGRRGCESFDPKEYVQNYYQYIGALKDVNNVLFYASWRGSYVNYIVWGYQNGLSGRVNSYK